LGKPFPHREWPHREWPLREWGRRGVGTTKYEIGTVTLFKKGGKMNIKRMVMAAIAVFIGFQVMDYVIHGVILSPAYKALAGVWRPDMMSKMWVMTLSSLVMSFFFIYIFIKGYENKGVMEGARYGIVAGLFMNVIGMFGQYVMYPIPFGLSVKWFVYGMVEFIVCGIIAALIYKPK
jgi:hypothetical protein